MMSERSLQRESISEAPDFSPISDNSVLPSLRDLNIASKEDRQSYTAARRRFSMPPRLNLEKDEWDDEDEFQETINNSPSIWRRTSLDSEASVPTRLRISKSQSDEVEVPPKIVRKRSISEDMGDQEFVNSDSEEEKPKKMKIKRPVKGRKGKRGYDCGGKDACTLCKNGTPYYLQKSMNPGWRETLLAVFEHFKTRISYRDWMAKQKEELGDTIEIMGQDDVSAKEHIADIEWLYLPDAYAFLENHWDILCPPQHKNRSFNGTNWRKTLQDTLSHNRTYFISGKDLFGKTGFWRLSDNIPVQNGMISDSRVFLDMKYRQMAPKPPSMFTIDAILKRAEAQGQIPSFCGSYNAVMNQTTAIPTYYFPMAPWETNPMTHIPTSNMTAGPTDLDLLVNAIEKMQNNAS